MQSQLIKHQLIGKYLYDIFFDEGDVVEYIEYSGRVQGSAFVLDHLLAAAQYGAEAACVAATGAGGIIVGANIACAVAQQRHTLYAKGGNGDLAIFAGLHRLTLFVEYFEDDEVGLVVAAPACATFGKCRLHLGRGICTV